MGKKDFFSPKQFEFIFNANAKHNLAHGAVRTGKTVCTVFKFLQVAHECPGDTIIIFGYSLRSIYNNVIALLLSSEELSVFRPFCTYSSQGFLYFGDKMIQCIGAGDEGALGKIQGITVDLCYCDEMTLYPEVVIDMIHSRLSRPHSKLYASMNPKHPTHKCKQWIDNAEYDSLYYALHFSLDDNPYLERSYINDLKRQSSGLFYKRNILGIWCVAEGAIYDFFDTAVHVTKRPPKAAEYWIAGIDYGTNAPFACVLIGVNTGRFDQSGRRWWVEKEYYWDSKAKKRQKTNLEYAEDIEKFLEPYAVKGIYVDPSCAAFKLDLRKKGMHVIDANNDVLGGIQMVASEFSMGRLTVCEDCKNLIKEIEGYVWDSKKAEKGEDEPLKGSGIMDHACFVAGTIIAGCGPIENIVKGDYVYTRNGFRKINGVIVNIAECFEFEIANRFVSCTPEHPIFTVNSGWKKAADLIQSDILISMKEGIAWENMAKQKSSNGTGKNIDDILTLQKNLNDCILNVDQPIFIETFGWHSKDQFQKDIIYITSTMTHLTMIYPISNVFLQSSMQKGIGTLVNGAFQTTAGKQLMHGILAIKERSGIENMRKSKHSENGVPRILLVRVAEKFIKLPRDLTQSFVQISVNLNGGEILQLILSLDNVLCVLNSFQEINIPKPNIALESVRRRPIGKKKVYNLSVEKDEEYFAEGLLAHNCDALRYAVATHYINKPQSDGDGRNLGFDRKRVM